MKKFYILFSFLLIGTMATGQIGYDWWQWLPADYDTNPYARQNVKVNKVADAFVIGANTLTEVWNNVPAELVYPIDNWTNGGTVKDWTSGSEVETDIPAQDAADFTGSYSLMAGTNALYVIFNVTDDDVLPDGGDFPEIAFAPYVNKFDPGRPIYADESRSGFAGYWWADSLSHVWGWNSETGMPHGWGTVIKGDTYVDMSKYGSWHEGGAYKIDLKLETNLDFFAATVDYSLKGENLDTLGNVGGGTIPTPVLLIYEPTTDGYLFLTAIPWGLMNDNKLENIGDQMSIAVKINDQDANNFSFQNEDGSTAVQDYQSWGGTDNNNVYWAIAFYGAVAELVELTSTYEPLTDVITAYYSNEQLNITYAEGDTEVEIFSSNGIMVKKYKGENTMNISSLNAGFYVANISDRNGNRTLVKFVKTN